MQLEQSFEVDAPLDRVWAALIDVERVAPCLPGAALTGRNDDGSYNGTFTIKIGPTTASYTGKLEMQNIDESSHSATMHAQGSDRRGQGGATATINSRLTPADGRTRVEVMTDYHITGRLARFGRGGMIEDISERLLRDFASRLQASLTYSGGSPGGEEPPPAPVTEQPTAPHSIEEEEEVAEAQASEVSEVSEVSEQPTTESPVVGFDAPAPPPTEVAAPAAEEPPPPPPAPAPEAPPPPPAPEAPPPPPAPEAPPPPPPESEPPPPLDGMSLVGSVLINRVKRNPAPVIAVVGGLVLLRLVMRKR